MASPFSGSIVACFLFLGVVAGICGGCDTPDAKFRLGTTDGSYDHYLTWVGYSNRALDEDANLAIYVLDGVYIGIGECGFSKVLQRLSEFDAGQDVLVFPWPGADSYDLEELPFSESQLDEALRSRRLTLHIDERPTEVVHEDMRGRKSKAVTTKPVLGADEHSLTWAVYYGQRTEDTKWAAYFVDGVFRGHGASGWASAVDAIQRLPKGSTLLVSPCYQDRWRFPFRWEELEAAAQSQQLVIVGLHDPAPLWNSYGWRW